MSSPKSTAPKSPHPDGSTPTPSHLHWLAPCFSGGGGDCPRLESPLVVLRPRFNLAGITQPLWSNNRSLSTCLQFTRGKISLKVNILVVFSLCCNSSNFSVSPPRAPPTESSPLTADAHYPTLVEGVQLYSCPALLLYSAAAPLLSARCFFLDTL